MKPTQGNGWTFAPATDEKSAIWAGRDSIFNVLHKGERPRGNPSLGKQAATIGLHIAALYAIMMFNVLTLGTGAFGMGAIFVAVAVMILSLFRFGYFNFPRFIGGEWLVRGEGVTLTFRYESRSKILRSPSHQWEIELDEIASIESGKTIEWETLRQHGHKNKRIPEAEYQVFIFTNDQRRLVVHTANAAREDCQRLAHSIRSYVEAQRGTPATALTALPSEPENDGFDL